jgi:beta-aspartyl-peptidase (threonine type)
MVGKRSGRVGDAPLPGCGFFADDQRGAAACTGWGERIMRLGVARRGVDLCREHPAPEAGRRAIAELADRVGGHGGIILLAADCTVGHAFNTESMAFAYRTDRIPAPYVGGVAGR